MKLRGRQLLVGGGGYDPWLVNSPVCPKHPRGGRNVDVTLKRVVVECFQCSRRLVVLRGPFRTTVSS